MLPSLRNLSLAFAIFGALLLAGCSAGTEINAGAERHPVHGVVQSLDPQAHTATIKHDDIPGFMGPMTMEYPIKDGATLARLHKGEIIDGTIFVQDSNFWLGEIREAK